MNPALQVFLAFVVGLGAGIVLPSEGALHAVEPLGTLWINALRTNTQKGSNKSTPPPET